MKEGPITVFVCFSSFVDYYEERSEPQKVFVLRSDAEKWCAKDKYKTYIELEVE